MRKRVIFTIVFASLFAFPLMAGEEKIELIPRTEEIKKSRNNERSDILVSLLDRHARAPGGASFQVEIIVPDDIENENTGFKVAFVNEAEGKREKAMYRVTEEEEREDEKKRSYVLEVTVPEYGKLFPKRDWYEGF